MSREKRKSEFMKIMDRSKLQQKVDKSENRYSEHFLKSCSWCNVELPNEASAIQHLLGIKHKKSYHAEEEKKRIERNCGLFIRGYPLNYDKQRMLTYFSSFGTIIWVNFEHSYLLLDYDDPAAVEKVFKKNHYLGGHKLMIQYRQPKKQVSTKSVTDEEINIILKNVKNIPSFEKQIQILGQSLQPNVMQLLPKYNKICQDIYLVLRVSFPYCQIHPFGSTITGLSFDNSDIDLYVSGISNGNKDVRLLYKTKYLLNRSQLFSNVIAIPHAKIPILKCIHIETGINCDVNFKNLLGVCNSHLINYYLNLDGKLRKLMVLLKFWAKTHRITGQNHLFTNYSLNLMLIFFLQHKPFEIPSVWYLQQDPQFSNIQDGWNGGFQPILFINQDLTNITLLKLLELFFAFYIDYDYGVNVICPYMGISLKKQLFKYPNSLPESFHAYKYYIIQEGQPLKFDTAICVQDPFEHSRNTTPIVSVNTLEIFVSFCRLGKKFCEEGENLLVYRLLTETPPNLAALTVVKPQSSKFELPMRPGLKYIEEKYEKSNERHKAWFDSVTKFTRIVLENFFKFSLTEEGCSSTSKTKHKKTEGQADVYGAMKVSYKCSGKLNLWQGRKSVAKLSDNKIGKGIVEKEKAITEQLCSLYKDIIPDDNIISFEISMEHCVDPPKVVFHINKIAAYKNSFISFMTFFSVKLPFWFKIFEQEQEG